jgi:hypothetical protein
MAKEVNLIWLENVQTDAAKKTNYKGLIYCLP